MLTTGDQGINKAMLPSLMPCILSPCLLDRLVCDLGLQSGAEQNVKGGS